MLLLELQSRLPFEAYRRRYTSAQRMGCASIQLRIWIMSSSLRGLGSYARSAKREQPPWRQSARHLLTP